VTKDYGANFFGDFTHWVDVNVTSLTNDNVSRFFCWAVSDAADDLKDIEDASGDCIFVGAVRLTTDTYYAIKLFNVDGGAKTDASAVGSISVNTPVYLSINRTGTTLTVQVYSTAALRVTGGAGDVGTSTLTVVNTTFQYVHGLASYNRGDAAKDISGTVSNLRIGTRLTDYAGTAPCDFLNFNETDEILTDPPNGVVVAAHTITLAAGDGDEGFNDFIKIGIILIEATKLFRL